MESLADNPGHETPVEHAQQLHLFAKAGGIENADILGVAGRRSLLDQQPSNRRLHALGRHARQFSVLLPDRDDIRAQAFLNLDLGACGD